MEYITSHGSQKRMYPLSKSLSVNLLLHLSLQVVLWSTIYMFIFIQMYVLHALYNHRWELPDKYPVLTVVMSIYHYVEIIGELSLPLIFLYNIYDHQKYYPGEPVNIHI